MPRPPSVPCCVMLLAALCMQAPPTILVAQQTARSLALAFLPGPDGAAGSAMTLQQLQQARQTQTNATQQPELLRVNPAAEPSPALRYRLYPARWELRPGSALLHFTRAHILLHQFPNEKQKEWQEWSRDENDPSDQDLAATLVSLDPVFDELHELAQSEDLTWDHRIRDVRGMAVYHYQLSDVHEVRPMVRLLSLKIRHQLKKQDFDGAFSSISDGLRLAEFVGQGETLIQKVVGLAMASIIRGSLQEAIATPGCPNLYWALASIPQPLIRVSDVVLWEVRNIPRVLPVLEEAETANWTDEEAIAKWASLVEDLDQLGGNGGFLDHRSRGVFAIASVTFVDVARERLLANGVSEARLETLPPLQIVLLDASRELRRIGDDVGKAHLLPVSLAKPLVERESEVFQRWQTKNRISSVPAMIAGILFPPGGQVLEAETRVFMAYNRLMTVEALRMHAAEHAGELPATLAQLNPVPAMLDPFTNQPFEYRIETHNDVRTIVLSAAGPLNYKPLQELRVQLVE